ncbi:M20 family metallopeptidase [Halobellus captivus]|uniref:M20 family metallopeptidase n=1 Tax=Halobellus captivus TaxID=2592614 RepID=UPI001EF0EDF5|nr:M20/M25/M40 family metallo-hydrolase [Halobellus captivus]
MSANRTELVALTRRLVSIPSHEDETAAGDAIESWLRGETDAAVTRDRSGNVLARRGDGEASLALVGHHDVVAPDDSQLVTPEESQVVDGTETDPGYVVDERDGRLYGRGTADMKGSLAAAMVAFRDADPAGELVFASFVGEERGGVGARAAIADGFAPDYAVVGEGSTNYAGDDQTDVVIAHRGRRGSTITARGAAAHASEPESGENAVYRACDAVGVVRGLDAPEATVLGERVRGSVVVTEIAGGTAWNVIPERCTATVDERTVPGERAPLERVEEVDGVEWTVDQDLPPMACRDEAFADAALAAADGAQSATPDHVTKPHATDAGWLAAAGTDCVVVGASEPGEAHTATESVSIDVLRRCRRIYQDLAERWPQE